MHFDFYKYIFAENLILSVLLPSQVGLFCQPFPTPSSVRHLFVNQVLTCKFYYFLQLKVTNLKGANNANARGFHTLIQLVCKFCIAVHYLKIHIELIDVDPILNKKLT